MRKTQLAKMVRMLSVPPVMISVLILILYIFRNEYFSSPLSAMISIILLGVVPVLAYPLQHVLPKYRNSGRDGQRKLAFVSNLIGYTLAFLWAVLCNAHTGLRLVCATYFFSVVILFICNVLHFKASGHASSFTGPLLILVYAFGWELIIPCTLVAAAIMWSSVYLKRHTMQQLLGGILACAFSFVIALGLIHFTT